MADIRVYLYFLLFVLSCVKSSSTNIQNPPIMQCQRSMTLAQIRSLLAQSPCAMIEKKINDEFLVFFFNETTSEGQKTRIKRDTVAAGVDIHALQTTINDHRTMINYLINNTVNATYVANAITDHHSGTGPFITSWRDILHLLFATIMLAVIIYFLVCRMGCGPCDAILSLILKPYNARQEEKQDNFVLQPVDTVNIRPGRVRNVHSMVQATHVSNIEQDMARRHHRDSAPTI